MYNIKLFIFYKIYYRINEYYSYINNAKLTLKLPKFEIPSCQSVYFDPLLIFSLFMYFLYMNSEVHLTWPFLHNNANSKSRSGRFKNIVVPALITRVFRKSHPLNRGPDSLWSLKIPGCPSKKSRGITQASWPNFPIGLWPSWPSNHPHTLIGFITRCPLHQ